MRKFTLLLVMAMAFIGINAQIVIQNGGFENWKADETPENWFGTKTSIDSASVLKSSDAFEGTSSVQLIRSSTSHKRFTTDSMEVKSGISYELSFLIKGEGEIRTGLFDGRASGSGYSPYNAYVAATSEWTLVKQVLTAQYDTTGAEFILSVRNTSVDGIFVDSVSIIELKNSAEILSFVLAEELSPALINSETAQVTATVLFGTDLTALTPEITISEGAQITPTTITDFTQVVKYLVTAEDGTEKVWSVAVTTLEPSAVSIHDIQFTEDASGDSPYKDMIVSTSGVVAGIAYNGFFLQDGDGAWNGIWIYTGDAPAVALGDMVAVSGPVKEYFNLTEIEKPFSVEVTGAGTIPAAVVVALADFNEAYEGVLVTVEGVSCSEEIVEFGEWNVSDGTNEIVVDDVMFAYEPKLGEQFESITGCVTYSYSEYKLEPRDADDIILVAIAEDQLSAVKMYPNPVKGQLLIENLDGVSKVLVSNVLGQKLLVKEVNDVKISINTSDFNTGVYIITLVSENGVTRSERIIKE